MPLDDLPNEFFVPTRDELLRRWLRDVKLRQPSADVSEDTQPFIDGSTMVDQLVPLYANSQSVGRDADLEEMTSAGLEAEAVRLGLPKRLPATGGAGTVTFEAAAGGATLQAEDEIKDLVTGYRYRVMTTNTYLNGNPVPIVGKDTGPATNLAANTVLSWTSPRPGSGATAKVTATADGKGLLGGRDVETDSQLKQRIRDARSKPAAAGNEAFVRRLVKEAADLFLIAVEDGFVFPCGSGPGSLAFCFTLRPSYAGASRVPNATQIASVAKYVEDQLPKDYSILKCSILESAQTVALKVRWRAAARGWADNVTFPPYQSTLVKVTAVTSALAFTVDGTTSPQVGQRIAFYDAANRKFVRKTILTVGGGSGAWTIACATAGGASDTVYVPSVNEPFCPWSDSLPDLVSPSLAAFDGLGPGEQRDAFFDAGYRQRRVPVSPEEWPSDLTMRAFNGLDETTSVRDWQVAQPTLPLAVTTGVPNVSSYLLTPARILAFPL